MPFAPLISTSYLHEEFNTRWFLAPDLVNGRKLTLERREIPPADSKLAKKKTLTNLIRVFFNICKYDYFTASTTALKASG
jgi:hypothetical protein